MSTSFEFDDDTRVRSLGSGAFAARVSDRWGIGVVPNGGYVLAVAMAGLRETLPFPDPLTITSHFLRPAKPGDARIEVETVKRGRRFATAMARLVQDAGEVLRVLATYGDLSLGDATGAWPDFRHVAGTPPSLPERGGMAPLPADDPIAFRSRVDLRLAPESAGFAEGKPSSRAEMRGWIRFADGRPVDVHALGLMADAFPPAVFQLVEPGWVPTVELTVHVRSRPTSSWLAGLFQSRFIQNGMFEEDGELWDESGTLVALSRQLALLPRRQSPS